LFHDFGLAFGFGLISSLWLGNDIDNNVHNLWSGSRLVAWEYYCSQSQKKGKKKLKDYINAPSPSIGGIPEAFKRNY